MMTIENFKYLLKRLKRDPGSPAGIALRDVFIGGEAPGIAARKVSIPMIRFEPLHDEAKRIANSMTLTEADGFTAAELVIANRALAVSRAKEEARLPNAIEYFAIERIFNAGCKFLKSMDGLVDQLPAVALSTLWELHSMGVVEANLVGGSVFEWVLTEKGKQLRNERTS